MTSLSTHFASTDTSYAICAVHNSAVSTFATHCFCERLVISEWVGFNVPIWETGYVVSSSSCDVFQKKVWHLVTLLKLPLSAALSTATSISWCNKVVNRDLNPDSCIFLSSSYVLGVWLCSEVNSRHSVVVIELLIWYSVNQSISLFPKCTSWSCNWQVEYLGGTARRNNALTAAHDTLDDILYSKRCRYVSCFYILRTCKTSARYNMFCHRILPVWNYCRLQGPISKILNGSRIYWNQLSCYHSVRSHTRIPLASTTSTIFICVYSVCIFVFVWYCEVSGFSGPFAFNLIRFTFPSINIQRLIIYRDVLLQTVPGCFCNESQNREGHRTVRLSHTGRGSSAHFTSPTLFLLVISGVSTTLYFRLCLYQQDNSVLDGFRMMALSTLLRSDSTHLWPISLSVAKLWTFLEYQRLSWVEMMSLIGQYEAAVIYIVTGSQLQPWLWTQSLTTHSSR